MRSVDDEGMGKAEMKYRFECKMEQLEDEVSALGDTIRDEVVRLDSRLDSISKVVEQMGLENKDALFNLQTEQKIIRRSTM